MQVDVAENALCSLPLKVKLHIAQPRRLPVTEALERPEEASGLEFSKFLTDQLYHLLLPFSFTLLEGVRAQDDHGQLLQACSSLVVHLGGECLEPLLEGPLETQQLHHPFLRGIPPLKRRGQFLALHGVKFKDFKITYLSPSLYHTPYQVIITV